MSYSISNTDKYGLSAQAFAQVLKPIEQARGLPNSVYLDGLAHEGECAHVFADGWACVGAESSHLDVPSEHGY